jgi:hypothetical protein
MNIIEYDFWDLVLQDDRLVYVLPDHTEQGVDYYLSLGYGIHGDTTPKGCDAV